MGLGGELRTRGACTHTEIIILASFIFNVAKNDCDKYVENKLANQKSASIVGASVPEVKVNREILGPRAVGKTQIQGTDTYNMATYQYVL